VFDVVAVGSDGSDTADRAVEAAAELARRFDARLVLVSAFSRGEDRPPGPEAELEWRSSPGARLRERLSRMERRLRQQGVDCSVSVDEGDPGEVLVRLADECAADVLVVGNKGMRRRVLGSVPNTVTHKARCSVLVVKTT
jgi:nucleotide-binding universal stress UspA family protein